MTYRIAHSLRQLLHRFSRCGKRHRMDFASRRATSSHGRTVATAGAEVCTERSCIDSLPATQILDAQTGWPTHRIRRFLSTRQQ